MPAPGGNAPPKVSINSTFATWEAWIDAKAPGQGDVFLQWVQDNNSVGSPLDVNASTFGKPPSNKAANWVAAWILQGNVAPGLAKIIAGGIGSAAKKIPGELKGAGQGIGKTPGIPVLTGIKAIGDFASRLTEAPTWERVGLAVLGIVLLGIGVARITGTQNAVSQIVKARIP